MARCYSGPMRVRQPQLPAIWLVTDARNDAALETALADLPRGSGVIFRHHHVDGPARRARFEQVARLARRHGHWIVLAGSAAQARAWRADGAYGNPNRLARGPDFARLCTAHSLREIADANRTRTTAVLLSPVFHTRSHPGAKVLGPVRFRVLATRSAVPVIALGGMTARRARALGTMRWAAIDGLSSK